MLVVIPVTEMIIKIKIVVIAEIVSETTLNNNISIQQPVNLNTLFKSEQLYMDIIRWQ